MTPEQLAKLDALKAARDAAEEYERETRTALYAYVQQLCKTGDRGTAAEILRRMKWSRPHLDNIKAGRWFKGSAVRDANAG